MGIILKKTDQDSLVKTEVNRIKIDDSDLKTAEASEIEDQEVTKKELIVATIVVLVLIAAIGLVLALK